MAVTTKGSVKVVSADNDTIAGNFTISGILYKAGTGGPSASIKSDTSAAGTILWETVSATDVFHQVAIRVEGGLHIDMAGTGTVLYIYTQVR